MKKILLSALFVLLLTQTASAQATQRANGVTFSNIAAGELTNKEWTKNFNVKISMASESGVPYGGVYLRIFNADGLVVFKQLCEKPLLFLMLPAGNYSVVGVDRKQTQKSGSFTVKQDNPNPATLNLVWPESEVGY
jgi:hypothetical protein